MGMSFGEGDNQNLPSRKISEMQGLMGSEEGYRSRINEVKPNWRVFPSLRASAESPRWPDKPGLAAMPGSLREICAIATIGHARTHWNGLGPAAATIHRIHDLPFS
jgi:hypothetical protein